MNTVQEFISITPWTIVFSICNLLILCALIKKFLFKPVMSVLEARQKEIDDIYGAADKDRSDAEALKAEYTRRMSGARAEADGIVRTAMDSARRKSDQIVNEANSQAARMKQKAQSEIEQEKRKAFAELQGELSGMAVDIAEKMVEREINGKDHQTLIDDFIRNAGDVK
ncbi:MAG: F0F1 ATP synthase subunit B [Candidatus Faecivicinus sp.]